MILPLKTKALKIFLFSFSFFLILAISLLAYNSRKTKFFPIPKILTSNWDDTESLSTHVSAYGKAGAFSFKNLFFFKENYLIGNIQDSPQLDPANILSPNHNYFYEIKNCDQEHILKMNLKHASQKFTGTTLIFSASKYFRRFQDHYFHFCEELILAYSILKESDRSKVDTIIFPNKRHWEGLFNQINAQMIQALFPNAQVINSTQFAHLSKKYLLKFDDVVFVDRQGCHTIEESHRYNNMLVGNRSLTKQEHVRDLKDALHQGIKTYKHPTRKPYITYIQRSTLRYLEREFEKKLLKDIATQFPQYTINPVKFENYTYPEQLQIIRNTKVLIGVHGCGLTHQLFLPNDSLVIEIFPKETRSMDYAYYAGLCGHTYYGLSPEKGVISQAGDCSLFYGDVNQTITEFETTLVTDLIKEYTSDKQTSGLSELLLDR